MSLITRLSSGAAVLALAVPLAGGTAIAASPSSWQPIAALPITSLNSDVTAVGALPNGEIFARGRLYYDENFVYNPSTRTWRVVARTGSADSVFGQGQRLADGRVAWFDWNSHVYDATTNTWRTGPGAGTVDPWQGATTALLDDGRVIVTGGKLIVEDFFGGGVTIWSSRDQIFDPASLAATDVATPDVVRHGAQPVVLRDGRVLLAGGADGRDPAGAVVASASIYDPATNLWSAAAPMRQARTHHAAVRLPDGRVLVAGGTTADVGGTALSSVEIYDPIADTWTSGPGMPQAAGAATASGLAGGGIVVFTDSGDDLYEPAQGAWTSTNGGAPGIGIGSTTGLAYSLDGAANAVLGNSAPSGAAHVGDIDASRKKSGSKWTATATVLVSSATGQPVAGATVTGTWLSGVQTSCTTGTNGRCSHSLGLRLADTVTQFAVTNVSHPSSAYQPSANSDPDGDSDGTRITISLV